MSAAAYILTASGRQIGPGAGVPSLSELAVALSRQPRFGGHCRRWWSVLDHSLFVAMLAERYATAQQLDGPQTRALVLAALLHDAHEAYTGDVPSPFKGVALRNVQHLIDQQIMREYFPGAHVTYDLFAGDVHALDHRALLAEAVIVGPECLRTFADVAVHFGQKPNAADVAVLRHALTARTLGADFPVSPREGGASRKASVDRFLRWYADVR